MDGIVVFFIIILFILCLRVKREYKIIFIVAFLFRLFLYVSDLSHLFRVFGSGADTEHFNYIANYNILYNAHKQLTHYTVFLTEIYYLTDCSRAFAQMINLYFGMGVLWMCSKTVDYIGLPLRRCKIALWILALLPSIAGFSAILLREAWVEFFVAVSIYQFVKWYFNGSSIYIVTTLIATCCAVYMHDGVLGLICGYLIAFALYSPKQKRIVISPFKVFMICFFIVVLIAFSSSFLGEKSNEFMNNSSEELLMKYANYDDTGNSAYLTWLPNASNPLMAFLYSPLEIIYLLLSPLPTEWNRFIDIEGFFADSIFYLVMIWGIYRNKAPKRYKYLKRSLIISVGMAIFLFAFGTFNAGTAMRHRAKFVEPIAIIYAISFPKQKKRSES